MLLKNISKWERTVKTSYQQKSNFFQQAVAEGTKKNYDFNEFSQDVFSSLYQIKPEVSSPSTGTAWAKQALDVLEELSEFKKLRQQTVTNGFESGLGASMLTKHLAQTLPERELPNPDSLQKEIEMYEDFLQNYPGSPKCKDLPKKIQNLQKKLDKAEGEWAVDDSEGARQNLRMQLRKAVQGALGEIAESNQSANPFGFGTEPGKDGFVNSEAKQALAEKVKKFPKLRQIAELAGRFKNEALYIQSHKKNPGPDEITDVEVGHDLGRVLPSEMMKLGDPLLQYDFFKGYLESTLLQYKMDSCEKEVKGPIVVCIDNSGSMSGSKEVWSKAIALAMCAIAVEQKRPFEIIHFNTRVARVDAFDTSNVDSNKLTDTCMFFSSGGTNFEPALDKAMADIISTPAFKKADIIMITDGECEISDKFVASFNAVKVTIGCSLYSIVLSAHVGELKKVSDRYLEIQDLRDDADAKEAVFSI
jgi:uncharacterized protein with von Willebrand factor type A (vWA) domain